jgi:hypothetical protein
MNVSVAPGERETRMRTLFGDVTSVPGMICNLETEGVLHFDKTYLWMLLTMFVRFQLHPDHPFLPTQQLQDCGL